MADDQSLAATVAELSVPQKAALCLGSDFWHTAPIGEFGIAPVMVSDGPHGLRKQPQPGDSPGRFGSVPATCFPTASALASGEEGHVRYGEGVFVGYRGYDAADRPVAYPFGHGLTYTSFSYRDLRVTQAGSADAGDLAITVRCVIGNTGSRSGREVVQVYVGDPAAAVARPPRELKAFAKVSLEPGAELEVTFGLTARDLSYWSAVHRRWVLEPGEFQIAVGASSRDIRLTQAIVVVGTPPAPPLTGMSTLAEWLADPSGGPALRAAFGAGPDGQPGGILASDELVRMLRGFPLSTLAVFGAGITHKQVESLIAAMNQDAIR